MAHIDSAMDVGCSLIDIDDDGDLDLDDDSVFQSGFGGPIAPNKPAESSGSHPA